MVQSERRKPENVISDRRTRGRRTTDKDERNDFAIIESESLRRNRAKICEIISDLPPALRTVLMIHEFGGLNINEVAGIMKVSSKTVESDLSTAWGIIGSKLSIDSGLVDETKISNDEKTAIKKAFDTHINESTSDEQIDRILKPVLDRIQDNGK